MSAGSWVGIWAKMVLSWSPEQARSQTQIYTMSQARSLTTVDSDLIVFNRLRATACWSCWPADRERHCNSSG